MYSLTSCIISSLLLFISDISSDCCSILDSNILLLSLHGSGVNKITDLSCLMPVFWRGTILLLWIPLIVNNQHKHSNKNNKRSHYIIYSSNNCTVYTLTTNHYKTKEQFENSLPDPPTYLQFNIWMRYQTPTLKRVIAWASGTARVRYILCGCGC